MKKNVILASCFLSCGSIMISQNLVPNNSFEIITSCPIASTQICLAPPWFQPNFFSGINNSSSDLFNVCCTISSQVSVPINIAGYQNARTGIGYGGIYGMLDTNNTREYIEVPLSDTLIANRKYCVEFYLSLANSCYYAISNMGAYFSADSLIQTTLGIAINYVIPQIENPTVNMLNDTTNWMLVSGFFIANGGERFMTIGNFHNPANTNSQIMVGGTNGGAYYYIDDVSVIDCTGDGVNEVTDANGINIYPNPATDAITIELKTKTKQVGMIEIKDVLGQVVYSSKINTSKTVIDLGGFAKGVYFVEVGNERQKIVKE